MCFCRTEGYRVGVKWVNFVQYTFHDSLQLVFTVMILIDFMDADLSSYMRQMSSRRR